MSALMVLFLVVMSAAIVSGLAGGLELARQAPVGKRLVRVAKERRGGLGGG